MNAPAFHPTLPDRWIRVPPIVIGNPGTGEGTPDAYVTAVHAEYGQIRVDLYVSEETASPQEDARFIQEHLVIGFQNGLHFIQLAEPHTVQSYELEWYFGGITEIGEAVLVTSAQRVRRLSRTGELIWTSPKTGLDGVVIDDVEDDLILGRGEWDPPDGWRPFKLHIDSGR